MKKIISIILVMMILATSLCTVAATEVKATVYVYVNDIQTGDEDFWAWIWDENTKGHWELLEASSGGYYTVNLDVGVSVIFARIRRAEQPDWSLVWNQSEDTKYTGEYNCVALKYSNTIGGKMSVQWKNIIAVEKNHLTSAMREAEKYLYEEPDKYTTDSLNVLWNAYYNAQSCYESATTQEQFDKATNQLNTAISQLVQKEEPETVDKTMLRVAIDTATSYYMSLDKFTDESWNAMEEKLADANAVYINENATQAEVDLVTQELLNAIDGLVRVKELSGDVDGDGVVSIMDATLIQRHLAQLEAIDEDRFDYADTDKNGEISIVDATMVQRFIAQLIPKL